MNKRDDLHGNNRGPKSMAKKQRSLLLDESLGRLIDAFQEGSGATFTRIVTAAILQYLLREPGGPDPLWMRFAVTLERENNDIPGILLKNVTEDLRRAIYYRDTMKMERQSKDVDQDALERNLEMFRRDIEKRETRKALWESILYGTADSPLDGLIAMLSEKRYQYPTAQ